MKHALLILALVCAGCGGASTPPVVVPDTHGVLVVVNESGNVYDQLDVWRGVESAGELLECVERVWLAGGQGIVAEMVLEKGVYTVLIYNTRVADITTLGPEELEDGLVLVAR